VQNTSTELHVFHIHQTDFQVLEVDGTPQPYPSSSSNIPSACGLLAVKARFVMRAPLEEVVYQTNGMTAVMVARAWVLYARRVSPAAG